MARSGFRYLFKELVASGLLIGWGCLSIWLAYRIIRDGAVTLIEPNPYIIWAELIGGFIVIGLAIERLVDDFKRIRRYR